MSELHQALGSRLVSHKSSVLCEFALNFRETFEKLGWNRGGVSTTLLTIKALNYCRKFINVFAT